MERSKKTPIDTEYLVRTLIGVWYA